MSVPRGRLFAAFALASVGVACTRTGRVPAIDKGSLSVKGSDTMVLLGQRWAEEYMNANPTIAVRVTGGGSGTGIAALINGSTDICESSRRLTEREKADVLAKTKASAVETKVALDALAVYVNETSGLRAISLPALAKIYSGATTSWRDLGGPDHLIVLYGREDNSGTYAYFKEHVLAGQDFAAATQSLAGTSAVASAVKGDPFGIGYGGIAYLEGVRALEIKATETSTAVAPSLGSAEDGTYPVSRYLYFYTAGEPAEATRSFIDWVVGPGGQKIVTDVGYYPLPGKG